MWKVCSRASTPNLVAASGGVPVGSDIDFAIPYLRHVLAFLGITGVEVIAADQLNRRGEEAVEQARRQIHALVPPRAAADGAIVSAA